MPSAAAKIPILKGNVPKIVIKLPADNATSRRHPLSHLAQAQLTISSIF
jgi:hypothetical protein